MKRIALCAVALSLGGCASTYSNLVSGSKLGAAEYQPAVLPMEGGEAKYQQVLGVCRQVATNRQITAAQEAQLRTITGVTEGSVGGAVQGLQIGAMFKNAGLGGSTNRMVGIGLAAGLATSLASSFASGTNRDADETKSALLNCLRAADPGGRFYKVIE